MNEYSVGMKLAQPSRTLWSQCCWHALSSQMRRLRQAVVAWHFWPLIDHIFPNHLGECTYIKEVPQLCFALWEPSRLFTDMILPYLSTPTLSHTHGCRTVHPEPPLVLSPLTAYACGCWYGLLRKGFLNTHLCYTHCLPTPDRHLGMLFSPVFSA